MGEINWNYSLNVLSSTSALGYNSVNLELQKDTATNWWLHHRPTFTKCHLEALVWTGNVRLQVKGYSQYNRSTTRH